MIAVETNVVRLPGPPEVLPIRPDAVVDLQTADGVALVGGQWRYSDCTVEEIEFVGSGSPEDPLGPGTVPNRTYDVVPHAEAADFDDSGWRVLTGEEMALGRNGSASTGTGLQSRSPSASATSTRPARQWSSRSSSTTTPRCG